MKITNRTVLVSLGFISLLIIGQIIYSIQPVNAVPINKVRNITFPVLGPSSYSNDYTAPRSNGLHRATDIIARKGQRIVAATSGTISYVAYPQPSWGYAVFITDDDGYSYNYLHLNNDVPGTDNGKGGGMHAYAVDMMSGNRVVRGQHIGWIGDSGNAENTVPHLHFEIVAPDDTILNPYFSLKKANKIKAPKAYPKLENELMPYGRVNRAVNVAMGNIDEGVDSQIVTGSGAKGPPIVKVFDQDQTMRAAFFAYAKYLTGGFDVATGDVDGDGTDEIITALGKGAHPLIKIFEPNGALVGSFYAWPTSFDGELRVTAGDVDDDGVDEIIVTRGGEGPPTVKVFEPDGTLIRAFSGFVSTFSRGIDVASGDIDADGVDEIVVSKSGRTDSTIRTFSGDGSFRGSFVGYGAAYRGGLRISVGNVKTDTEAEEILAIPATAGAPLVRIFTQNGGWLGKREFIEKWWLGYHDVAAGHDVAWAGTGTNRRASVRFGID